MKSQVRWIGHDIKKCCMLSMLILFYTSVFPSFPCPHQMLLIYIQFLTNVIYGIQTNMQKYDKVWIKFYLVLLLFPSKKSNFNPFVQLQNRLQCIHPMIKFVHGFFSSNSFLQLGWWKKIHRIATIVHFICPLIMMQDSFFVLQFIQFNSTQIRK